MEQFFTTEFTQIHRQLFIYANLSLISPQHPQQHHPHQHSPLILYQAVADDHAHQLFITRKFHQVLTEIRNLLTHSLVINNFHILYKMRKCNKLTLLQINTAVIYWVVTHSQAHYLFCFLLTPNPIEQILFTNCSFD